MFFRIKDGKLENLKREFYFGDLFSVTKQETMGTMTLQIVSSLTRKREEKKPHTDQWCWLEVRVCIKVRLWADSSIQPQGA